MVSDPDHGPPITGIYLWCIYTTTQKSEFSVKMLFKATQKCIHVGKYIRQIMWNTVVALHFFFKIIHIFQ